MQPFDEMPRSDQLGLHATFIHKARRETHTKMLGGQFFIVTFRSIKGGLYETY